jgi:hypothetical protein
MEIISLVLVSLLVGLVPQVLGAIIAVLVRLLAHVIVVGQYSQVSNMDRLLADIGWCSARTLNPGRTPADGIHFLFMRGPAIAVRSSNASERGGVSRVYTIYATGPAAEAIRGRLVGNPRDIDCVYVYSPSAWRTSATMVKQSPPASAYHWQKNAVKELMGRYRCSSRVTTLVCGGPGVGKSSLGELLAVEMKTTLKVSPEVVKNMDLTAKGQLLDDAFGTPTELTPVILMLDEFDATVDSAESRGDQNKQREGASLAETPTALLTLLDRLGNTRHLIVIATSNKPLSEMEAGTYARYTRKGRLDCHVEAPAKNAC